MARRIISRIQVKGNLEAQSPIHVGGIGGNPEVDLALAVNGQGQYYIPGTSLAGAFRGWVEATSKASYVWGDSSAEGGHASFLLVEDAPIQGVNAEIRDGVGIDRIWGSAAKQVKYERAILPRGTKIPLVMMLEVPFYETNQEETISEKKYLEIFAFLIASLKKGHIRLGAAKTRGLGRVKLNNFSIRKSQLSRREDMLAFLLGKDELISSDQFLQNHLTTIQNSTLTLTINWEPQEPLMVKAEGSGLAVDILPLVSAVENKLAFVLPGSSIKGALRSHAERIVRTVLSLEMDSTANFMEQVDIPLVSHLFGARAKNVQRAEIGIGSLFVDDCYGRKPISPEAWRNIQVATNAANLRNALDMAGLENTQQAYHVAVDRWTGAAADGMLYSALELIKISWEPIHLTLNLDRLHEHKLAGISLLLLCLRDLADGRIPLGYGTNRGMGSIKVKSVHIQSDRLDPSLAEMVDVSLNNGSLTDLSSPTLNQLNSAWNSWIIAETSHQLGAN
jgi:CRISPR/Cas system CSM-associated protein Csm3 (group 7 of RAMP superfamily)